MYYIEDLEVGDKFLVSSYYFDVEGSIYCKSENILTANSNKEEYIKEHYCDNDKKTVILVAAHTMRDKKVKITEVTDKKEIELLNLLYK